MSSVLPLPGVQHGNRIMIAVIEHRAKTEPDSPWVSVPVDDSDLSKGYQDITFRQFNNAANHAAQWLRAHLPVSSEQFQCFAYTGPNDLRYAALAVAAGKLQKVMVLLSPLVTTNAALRILNEKNCKVYLRSANTGAFVDSVTQTASGIMTAIVPELNQLFQDAEPEPVSYSKSWDEDMDDPWFVFHTSGTTGNPNPITYTHRMLASVDSAAAISDLPESQIHQFATRRWYISVPLQHYVGVLLTLAMTSYLHMVAVRGPPGPPSPETATDILRFGRVDGALMTPSLIDLLCLTEEGLTAMRSLQYIHYAGAPLSTKSGKLIAPHVRLSPSIGSTEAGGYPTIIRETTEDWDYVAFSHHAGARLEPRFDNLHELVFIRDPSAKLQQIFLVHPDKDRFETNDLWVEHPSKKGLWKLVGRTDDYVYFSHGDGLHASKLEPEIENHPSVRAALIGGHGYPVPVLLIELLDEAQKGIESTNSAWSDLLESLQPFIDAANSHCHRKVQLSSERVIFASRDKPFVRTLKGSVARNQSLKLYEGEVAALFEAHELS